MERAKKQLKQGLKQRLKRRLKQLKLELKHGGRGGPRLGAGRPRGDRPRVLHRARQAIPGCNPLIVTVRVQQNVPRLRTGRFIRAFKSSLAMACVRPGFRVVHFLIEAQGKKALASGMKSIAARIARTVNRVFGRHGSVLDGRYHHRIMKTPREVRNGLAYVLLNSRKHFKQSRGHAPAVRLDVGSSGWWFDGWTKRPPGAPPDQVREVAAPRTWLMHTGWHRYHPRVDPAEAPGGRSVHR